MATAVDLVGKTKTRAKSNYADAVIASLTVDMCDLLLCCCAVERREFNWIIMGGRFRISSKVQ